MARPRLSLVPALALLLVAAVPIPGEDVSVASEPGYAPECEVATDDPVLAVGVVGCLRIDSEFMGGLNPFSYWIPPACDPALGRDCPVLYYLHGTGGSYREGAGTKGTSGSSWVRALTQGPPVDPRTTAEPWQYANTATWVPQAPLDMIIVSPHGRTLPGGHGPAPHADAGWLDWNPRYAAGGEYQRYDTPPPRPLSHLLHELLPYVDATFPTAGTRAQRAVVGTSLGGIGALYAGLRHPDLWSSIGARSGGTLYSDVLTGQDEPVGQVVDVAPPADVPYVAPPGPTSLVAPPAVWEQMYGAMATVGLGDIAADNIWWAGSQPAAHAGNARARAVDGSQSLHVQYFVNDAVPRRTEDYTDEAPIQIAFEVILYPTNRYLELLFDGHGVERTFHVGPGTHSGSYSVAYHREQLVGQYARLRHWDGGGEPPRDPVVFDHRTIATDYAVWGWQVAVDRAAIEFLSLRDVSCDGLTLQGTGVVTVTVPARCRTGVDGSRTVTVDLGPSQATNEPTGLGASRTYGRTVTVSLAPLRACPPRHPLCP